MDSSSGQSIEGVIHGGIIYGGGGGGGGGEFLVGLTTKCEK